MDLIAVVLGCGGFWTLVEAACRRLTDKARRTVRRDEFAEVMEEQLDKSPLLQQISENVRANSERIEETKTWVRQHEEDTRRHRLIGLREAMMHDPTNRLSHEHMLAAGQEYLDSGGNGIGKTRFEQLQKDYVRRQAQGDWEYPDPDTDKH